MMLVGTELSSFLTNVWENREYILGHVDTPIMTDETVERRVYEIYATGYDHPVNGPIDYPVDGPVDGRVNRRKPRMRYKDLYRNTLHVIKTPIGKVPWKRTIRSPWFLFDAGGLSGKDTQASYRIYLNVKSDCVVDAFELIMKLGGLDLDAPQGPRALPPQPIPQRLHLPPRINPPMGFAGTIAAAKVADETQAFTRRPDKILVYLNKIGGELVAERLGWELGKHQEWFLPDIPPMTRFITWGVGIGPEVGVVQGVDQWEAGESFGDLRCNLIAQALLECMTGWKYDELSGDHLVWDSDFPVGRGNLTRAKVPVRLESRRKLPPIRQEFVILVEKLFRKYRIDPQKPWD